MTEQSDNRNDLSFPFLQDLCSDLSDEELKEADERFEEYWEDCSENYYAQTE